MCIKKPAAPELPPPAPPQPTREELSMQAEARNARRRGTQQGVFANIRTSALGDTSYNANTEMAKFGSVGSIV
jgi:hypothetical protein